MTKPKGKVMLKSPANKPCAPEEQQVCNDSHVRKSLDQDPEVNEHESKAQPIENSLSGRFTVSDNSSVELFLDFSPAGGLASMRGSVASNIASLAALGIETENSLRFLDNLPAEDDQAFEYLAPAKRELTSMRDSVASNIGSLSGLVSEANTVSINLFLDDVLTEECDEALEAHETETGPCQDFMSLGGDDSIFDENSSVSD